jgi:hypothetical protein
VDDCPKKIGKKYNLTVSQMCNRWRTKHATVEKMGWKLYLAIKEAKLHKYDQCGEIFLSAEGLKKHITSKHKPSCS